MISLPLHEFLAEMKAEIAGFEELGENRAKVWADRFAALAREEKLDKKITRETRGRLFIVAEDESELFSWADNYWAAVEEGEEEEYWRGFMG